ncbi:cupin domain-containing protein [Calditrichota bacterium GD2]
MKSKTFWINRLNLIPHPEGGFYSEVYRSDEFIPLAALNKRYSKAHRMGTSIYFLLPGDSFSAFHRLKSDELWHFYTGQAVVLYLLYPDGQLKQKLLGPDIEKGEQFQLLIPHGVWFAAQVLNGVASDAFSYALVGCTVAPGFEFEDFELARRDDLLSQFPEHEDIILRFTRK